MITPIEYLQPPTKLADGFNKQLELVQQKCLEKGAKLSLDEANEIMNNSFTGKSRNIIISWVVDINEFVETINMIINDLSDIRNDLSCFSGDPEIRVEFLFQSFFSEIYKIREISKIYLKILSKIGVFKNRNKKRLMESYVIAFNSIYDIRNKFIHLSLKMKNSELAVSLNFIESLSEEDRIFFKNLNSNTDNACGIIQARCIYYTDIIIYMSKKYIDFQESMIDMISDLILLFEKHNLNIEVVEIER